MFSHLTQQLIDALRGLPGIGPKSAQRIAFYLLSTQHRSKGHRLVKALEHALTEVKYCQRCRIYTEKTECNICINTKRDHSQLCVVESPADVMAIEQTNAYRGIYFVLHGHLSPLDGVGPQDIGIPMLTSRLHNESIAELILATNATMEGKATAHYIAKQIQGIKISQIPLGIPLGGEIEYLDGGTLRHAMNERIIIQSTQSS